MNTNPENNLTMSDGNFDFNAFVKESTDVLVKPDYFSTLKTSGGMTEPLIKAVIYGVIAGIFNFLWGVLHLTIGGSIFGGAVGVMAFFSSVIGALIGLFIGGVLMLILSAICKGNTDYEANVRVTAALMVMMPISAALGFASGVSYYLGIIVSLAVGFFGLWLTYKALVQALKAKPDTSRIAVIVLGALLLITTVAGIGAGRRMTRMMNDFNRTMEEMPKQ